MKVLLAGATGFLGTVVLRRLHDLHIDVVPVGRHEFEGGVVCDLADPKACLQLLDSVQPDAIINCAARVDLSSGGGHELYQINSLMPGLTADWCKRNCVQLVQASTIAVYGLNRTHVQADTVPVPDTDYGLSKLLGDQMVVGSGCHAAIIRLAGIFGPGGPAHLRINLAIEGALRGERPSIMGDGDALRSYIFVDDAASVMVHALQSGWSGIYVAGGADSVSVASMVQSVCEVILPGGTPIRLAGRSVADQVVVTSREVPPRRSFREAIEMIRENRVAGGHSR